MLFTDWLSFLAVFWLQLYPHWHLFSEEKFFKYFRQGTKSVEKWFRAKLKREGAGKQSLKENIKIVLECIELYWTFYKRKSKNCTVQHSICKYNIQLKNSVPSIGDFISHFFARQKLNILCVQADLQVKCSTVHCIYSLSNRSWFVPPLSVPSSL